MWFIGQYDYQTPASTGIGATMWALYIALIVAYIVANWKIFTKAGQAGWKAIIPIYSTVITCRIVGLSGWYTLLILVPFVNIIFAIYLAYKLAQSFGYGIGMTILELLLIGYLIMGFGQAKYIGPTASKPASSNK